MSDSSPHPGKGEQFTRLLTQHQRHLHAFLYAATQNRQAADDLLQDVGSILWKKFPDFENGTNFKAWAFRIARFELLNWRRKQERLPLSLDDDTLSSLMDEVASLAERQDERRDALDRCLQKLSEKNRGILRLHYHLGESVAEIAKLKNLSTRGVYKILSKVHASLAQCVREKMALTNL
ncbi:MAG: sigma-70 family RNA polymerase sigma factor [Verrucomicrobiota bacterium]